jgi:hypothetical protein
MERYNPGMASVLDPDLHRITVEEYHRMVEAGVFQERERPRATRCARTGW